MAFKPYDQVRVRQVSARVRTNAWAIDERAPQAGDSGAVVEVLHAPGKADLYVVECVDSSGHTVWLADFAADELERFEENA